MKALKIVAPESAGELNRRLIGLRNVVQDYLLNDKIPVDGWSVFRPTWGICDNYGVPRYDVALKHLMQRWSKAASLGGDRTYPVDGDSGNYTTRRETRWDQSTEWGRNRLALLDWLIIETGRLGI